MPRAVTNPYKILIYKNFRKGYTKDRRTVTIISKERGRSGLPYIWENGAAMHKPGREERTGSLMKTVLERFLEYISIDTTSREDSGTYPSSASQLELGRRLAEELKSFGIADVTQDEHGYVIARIPATKEGALSVGLVAHMDTSDAVSGADIRPRLVKYAGGDIVLNEKLGIVMKEAEFPFLENCVGKTMVVTDGTTLLGADDKAGVAEIMTAAQRMAAPDAPPHGKICIAFTPDEEISGGTKYFDVKGFGADLAYTVDGGALGELEYENFNAAMASVEITGRSIHPGDAKGRMVNAAVVGCEFEAMLPPAEQPAFTEGYEGFYHLLSMEGAVERCTMKIALREHDRGKFEEQKKRIFSIAGALNDRWGQGTVKVDIKDQYYNMRTAIEEHMEVVEHAVEAFKACGVEPVIQPIRGGTDGAKLSFLGLPCPNLSAGGYNFHGRFECVPVESMETMAEVLVKLLAGFAD